MTALREAETALDNYAADLDRLKELDAARRTAAFVAARMQELRRGGKVGGLAAVDAERGRIAADEAVAAAQADINADQIAIFLALGGGWS